MSDSDMNKAAINNQLTDPGFPDGKIEFEDNEKSGEFLGLTSSQRKRLKRDTE